MSRGYSKFKGIETMGDNAYMLQLLRDMAILATFNVGDLSPYMENKPFRLKGKSS